MGKNAIEVHNLSKEYVINSRGENWAAVAKNIFKPQKSVVKAVQSLNFEIKSGEKVGFIGKNGAGKTTTIKMLTGTLFPSSGYCKVNGYNPVERTNDFKKSISVVMGNRSQLFPDLTPQDYLELLQTMYDIPESVFAKTVANLARILNVTEKLDLQTRKLSLGERMKIEFLAGVATRPKVLFLDEPTIGLDVIAKRDIRKFLVSLNKEEKLTVFLTSHDMEDISSICDHLIIVDRGKIIWDGQKQELLDKFSNNKYISFIKSESFNETKIKAKIIDQDDVTITIKVPAQKVDHVIAQLAQNNQGTDYQINDLKLEDIILELFAEEN